MPGGRHQIGIPAGFNSESVAGFLSECLAGFLGIRNNRRLRRFDAIALGGEAHYPMTLGMKIV